MATPAKVVVLKRDSSTILLIDLTTAEERVFPFEYQSAKAHLFYFSESDLVCIQESPCYT